MSSLNFSDPSLSTEREVQFPLPVIQPDYQFLPDDAVTNTIQPIDTAFLDSNPNVIHYDIFAGMHFNLVDPFKYIWNTELLGHPHLDAEDLALFPPEIIEELIKDPGHKSVLPRLEDISDAKTRLLNMANFYHPDGDLDEEERKIKDIEANKTRTLDVIKPHMFTDEYSKAKTMQSAQANAMNYYYKPVYTEDTIQTWAIKPKFLQFAEQQKNLERMKNLGVKKSTMIPTTVSKEPESIRSYIDDSFAAMDEEPVYPYDGDDDDVNIPVFPTKTQAFFTETLPNVVKTEFPSHLPPLSQEDLQKYLKLNTVPDTDTTTMSYDDIPVELIWLTAHAESQLNQATTLTHEFEADLLDVFSLYRPLEHADGQFIEQCKESGIDVDPQAVEILNNIENNVNNVNVWSSLNQLI